MTPTSVTHDSVTDYWRKHSILRTQFLKNDLKKAAISARAIQLGYNHMILSLDKDGINCKNRMILDITL